MRTNKLFAPLLITLLAVALTGVACSPGPVGSSPTATFMGFFEAVKSKNKDGVKRTLSKGTLERMKSYAEREKTTLDNAVGLIMVDDHTAAKTPEMRNEKIAGDSATLEVHMSIYEVTTETGTGKSIGLINIMALGEWRPMEFVREDNQWKLNLTSLY